MESSLLFNVHKLGFYFLTLKDIYDDIRTRIMKASTKMQGNAKLNGRQQNNAKDCVEVPHMLTIYCI